MKRVFLKDKKRQWAQTSLLIAVVNQCFCPLAESAMPEKTSSPSSSHPLEMKRTAKEMQGRQSLRKVLTQALTNNPNLQADKAAKFEARYRLEQAKAGYLPTLDASGSWGYGYLRDKLRNTKLNAGVSGTVIANPFRGGHKGTGDIGLTARQMLFDGMDTPFKVEKAEAEKEQSAKKIHETLELVAFQVVREYFTVLRFQKLIRLAEKNVANHRRVLEKVNSLQQGGKGTLSDVKHVQARLEDAQSALQDIKGDLESSQARFIELVGQEPNHLISELIDLSLLPATLEAALKIADKTNRSLDLARSTVDVAKKDLNSTDTPFYPSLGLEGNAQKTFNALGESGNQTTLSAKAVVRYNLFNGGRDIARQKEYRARLTKAKCNYQAESRRTEREVRISKAEFESAKKQYDILGAAGLSKRQVMEAYHQQFDLGNRSYLEILEADHEWFLAEGGRITALAAINTSAARYLATLGTLAESFGWNKRTLKMKTTSPSSLESPQMSQLISDKTGVVSNARVVQPVG